MSGAMDLATAEDATATAQFQGPEGVDGVHDKIDELVLAIFEAVRSHDKVVSGAADGAENSKQGVLADKCVRVAACYTAALGSLDSMLGIEKTVEEQEEQLASVSAQISSTRASILESKKRLEDRRAEIDVELKTLLGDGALGIASSSGGK